MKICLDDITGAGRMYPFGLTKSVAHIRIGMFTLLERWQFYFGNEVSLLSESGLPDEPHKIYSALQIPTLETMADIRNGQIQSLKENVITLAHAADIFKYNEVILRQDYQMMTAGRDRVLLPEGVLASEPENIFIEPGASIEPCFIHAAEGPVYISKNALVMQGALLRGPLYIGQNSVVKMGAKIYGSTTLGPGCTAGGEIKNVVMMGYSNKAHDGYLGDSVLGEWCNLGAGTSNSNLKNNASEVRMQPGPDAETIPVGSKCGLLMGDYSRSAVNTTFNTGTVVGVCCNIYGDSPPKFIPSFTWGRERYRLDKALRDIDNWKKLKGLAITEEEKQSLSKLYQT